MRIRERDWILLSAFLDGELQAKRKQQLERRLEQDSDLSQALKDLSRIKNVLSQTPRLQVPRNFTLAEKPHPARKLKQPFFTYRLAAAVFSILLVGVLVIDSLTLLGSKDAALVSAPVFQEEVLEEVPNLALDSEAGGEQAETEKVVPEEAPAAQMEEAPEEEILAEGVMETESSTEIEQKAVESETEQETVEDRAGDERVLPTPSEMAPEQPPTPTARVVEQFPTQTIVPEAAYGSERPGFDLSPIRVIEILLGLGVIGFSLAAWKRRKS